MNDYSDTIPEKEAPSFYVRVDERSNVPIRGLRKDLCAMLEQQDAPEPEKLLDEFLLAAAEGVMSRRRYCTRRLGC